MTRPTRPAGWLAALLLGACDPDVKITGLGTTPPDELGDDTAAQGPDIEVTPSLLDFGAWKPSCTSDPQTVQITNVGVSDLTLTGLEVKGGGKLSFELLDQPTTVLAGASVEVPVVFSPKGEAVYDAARLEIASDDPDEPIVDVDLLGEGGHITTVRDEFLQQAADEVDVLFSIDYSGSMSDDIRALGNAFDTFITAFVQLGLDYHIAVITADPDCPEFQGPVITPATADAKAEFIAQTSKGGCFAEAGFGATMNALQPAMLAGTNQDFLRDSANLAVVVISDEPEQTEAPNAILPCEPPISAAGCLGVQTYVNFLVGLKQNNPGKVTFSGVVGPNRNSFGLGQCDINFAARRYHNAISQTNGVWGNLCQLDLQTFLTHLASAAGGVSSTFGLSATPEANDFEVLVDGQPVPNSPTNGWTYDQASNTITLNGSASPGPGQVVSVAYPAQAACDL